MYERRLAGSGRARNFASQSCSVFADAAVYPASAAVSLVGSAVRAPGASNARERAQIASFFIMDSIVPCARVGQVANLRTGPRKFWWHCRILPPVLCRHLVSDMLKPRGLPTMTSRQTIDVSAVI